MTTNKSIFIFGATSMVGYALVKYSDGRDITPFCNPYTKDEKAKKWPRLHLEDEKAYQKLFQTNQPDILIHCGGICDVDKCEEDPAWARRINVDGLAACLQVLPKKTRLVYISSDHVFGGRALPYLERSQPDPITVYGRLRVQAESLVMKKRKEALIIRPGLSVGPSFDGRKGHLNWLQTRTKRNLPVTVVSDEFRSAVWSEDAAKRIYEMAESSLRGIRHLAAERSVSREELAFFLNKKYRINAQIAVETRINRKVPHLGKVELRTQYCDGLAKPLRSVVNKG